METLAQLCANGTLPAVQSIVDSPSYRYRGFMLDTGRRFVPKSDVFNSLEAMAASKMNVLHMHLSDDQRCAVDSLTYPNLTGSLAGDKKGSYTYVANYSRNYQLTLTLLVDAL
jgi:hexosaminidase